MCLVFVCGVWFFVVCCVFLGDVVGWVGGWGAPV